MDLELLKRFYLVAKEGKIGKTAEKLNVVPSAITRSISDFEYQMKSKLFDRNSKGMHLTPLGEQLFEFAKEFLQQAEEFEKTFRENDQEISGDLKILTTPYIGAEWLPMYIKPFLDAYPDIRLRMILKASNLNPTEADVTISWPFPNQPHLHQTPFTSVPIKLFASPTYLEQFGVPLTPQDLNHHRLITYRGQSFTTYESTNWVLNFGLNSGQLPRRSYLEVESLSGMVNYADQGCGIAELPDLLVIRKRNLVYVLPEHAGPMITVHYIFNQRRKESKKIQAFLAYLRDISLI